VTDGGHLLSNRLRFGFICCCFGLWKKRGKKWGRETLPACSLFIVPRRPHPLLFRLLFCMPLRLSPLLSLFLDCSVVVHGKVGCWTAQGQRKILCCGDRASRYYRQASENQRVEPSHGWSLCHTCSARKLLSSPWPGLAYETR
jgi:hypothetical protein